MDTRGCEVRMAIYPPSPLRPRGVAAWHRQGGEHLLRGRVRAPLREWSMGSCPSPIPLTCVAVPPRAEEGTTGQPPKVALSDRFAPVERALPRLHLSVRDPQGAATTGFAGRLDDLVRPQGRVPRQWSSRRPSQIHGVCGATSTFRPAWASPLRATRGSPFRLAQFPLRLHEGDEGYGTHAACPGRPCSAPHEWRETSVCGAIGWKGLKSTRYTHVWRTWTISSASSPRGKGRSRELFEFKMFSTHWGSSAIRTRASGNQLNVSNILASRSIR